MLLRKKYLIPIFITLCLTSICDYCTACSSRGYIITQNQATILGKISVPWRSTFIDLINLIEFDIESFFYHVSFKKDSDKTYKTYYPTTISGFGFKHRSTNYIHEFLLESPMKNNSTLF